MESRERQCEGRTFSSPCLESSDTRRGGVRARRAQTNASEEAHCLLG